MTTDNQSLIARLVDEFGHWFIEESALAQGRMTADLYPYERLFSPIQLNGVKVKNRLVMGPMGNVSMADETGRPSAKMIQYFAERARGGVGLITSGLVPVTFAVDPSFTEPGNLSYFPRIDRSRTNLAGWRDLAETIHAFGARFFIQLTPGLGRVGSPECVVKRWRLPVSSSWSPNFYMPQIPCRPLSDGECRRIIRAAGQAAADAKACLIDGVYLHGHEGYLAEQFANPAFNRRRLGRFADGEAFGLELVREVRRRCGPDYPIWYRIGLSLALAECYGERMKTVHPLRRFQGERTVDTTLSYLSHLVEAGVDLFDLDLGCYENWWLPHPPGPMPPGCYTAVAGLVKAFFSENAVRTNAGQEVPVVAVGKLGYPDLAERVLREGLCDMVMLARPLLADPDWPNKAFSGRVREIIPCIGDHRGCIDEFIHGGHPQCTVNPRTGFEEQKPRQVLPAPRSKTIAVVGAGPAGVLCACLAAQRGHEVTLLERHDRAGGLLRVGSVPRSKFDVANYLAYLQDQLTQHARAYRLEVRFNTEATAELLRAGRYDVVVCCTGARPKRLDVEGADLPHVVNALDLLGDPSRAEHAERVVVVGGGEVGCEVAHFLAYERGKEVTVIEELPHLMAESCTANRGYFIHYLGKKGARLWTCARVQRIEQRAVSVVRNISPTVPSPYATWSVVLPENVVNPLARPIRVQEQVVTVPADLVVVAVGMEADETLYESCVAQRVAPEIHNIGDSFEPGSILEATRAGDALGRTL